jgi:stringent starvation protein B
MNSTRPYLIRAFYEWIADNDCTPHVVVNADILGVKVPTDYVESGQIVLNISMSAVQSLDLGDDAISFDARFGGVPQHIYIPVTAVMAIYARENGRGMVFTDDDHEPPPADEDGEEIGKGKGKGKSGSKKSGGRPHLTVVK